MSTTGTDFLTHWIDGHVDANIPAGHADDSIETLAAACIAAAQAQGLRREDLEDDNQTVEDVIRARMGAPTDGLIASVARRLGS